jgi:SHS2 domain-containing protein
VPVASIFLAYWKINYTEDMSEDPFVEIEHTADWSLRVRAENMEELLKNAAEGMFRLMGIERHDSKLKVLQFDVIAEDQEEMLVTWLEELLYHIETRGVTFDLTNVTVNDDSKSLKASLSEYPIHRIEKEIKAVTYHGLKIVESEDGLEVTVVFDV